MRSRSLISTLAILVTTTLAAPFAHAAGSEEERARNLSRDAMEQDYLATDFKAALAKLETALKVCGDKCSKELLARVYRNLGTVYAAGLGQQEQAVEAFKEMLRLEPTLSPDSNYLTGEVQKAYEAAKAAATGDKPTVVEKPVGVLKEEPWAEQATYHPVPIYVELPEGADATRVVVRFKGPKMADWSDLVLQKHEGGFGGLIPCAAVEAEGQLQYFVTAFDANLDRVASAGSAQEPRKVKLKKAIEGRQPTLPNTVPPSECPRPETVLSCETNDDCPGTQVCQALQCVESSTIEQPKADPATDPHANHFSLGFSPDLVLMQSANDACSTDAQSDGKLGCFYGTGAEYRAAPGDDPGKGSVKGGVGTGSMRILLGYDRIFVNRFALGARVGFAFLGSPTREDGKDFMPIHAEARFAFHIIPDAYAKKGVRPYVLANGGLGTFSGHVTTRVTDDVDKQRRTIDVYQTGRTAFVGGGIGIEYAVNTQLALRIEALVRQTLPQSSTVIAPTLAFAYGL